MSKKHPYGGQYNQLPWTTIFGKGCVSRTIDLHAASANIFYCVHQLTWWASNCQLQSGQWHLRKCHHKFCQLRLTFKSLLLRWMSMSIKISQHVIDPAGRRKILLLKLAFNETTDCSYSKTRLLLASLLLLFRASNHDWSKRSLNARSESVNAE